MMFSHDICIKIDLKKMSMYIELKVDNKMTITYISLLSIIVTLKV